MHQVCHMQTLQTWCTLDSGCHSDWLLGVVSGPAHGPRADVVEPAAGALPPVLDAFPQRKLEELLLAASQRSRNGAYLVHDNRNVLSASTKYVSVHHVCIKIQYSVFKVCISMSLPTLCILGI